jgi:beta-glucoside PTS system EIICBA component
MEQQTKDIVIQLVGGRANISFQKQHNDYLELHLKDQSIVKVEQITELSGVYDCHFETGVLKVIENPKYKRDVRKEHTMTKSKESHKYDKLASFILESVGGKENIISLTHCVTRLRFVLKDEDKANKAALEGEEGILTVVKSGGQYQVVIGNTVSFVYEAVCRIAGLQGNTSANENDDDVKGKNVVAKLLDIISSVMTPMLMVLSAAGMIKGLLTLTVVMGLVSKDSGTYTLMYTAGDAFFYFLPIILGYTASKKFKSNEFIGLALGSVLVYPTMVNLTTSGEALGTLLSGSLSMDYYTTFMGIPVIMPASGYTSSVVPIILAVFFAAKVEKNFKKIIPEIVRPFLVPVLTLAIMVPLTYIIIGPIAAELTNILNIFFSAIYDLPLVGGLLAGALVGGGFGILVLFGLHWALIPMAITNIAANGFDYILTASICGQFAAMACGIVVFFRTNDIKLKNISIPATISQIMGVGEPLMYGIMVPYKILFIGNCIAGAAGGAFIGLIGAKTYIMGGLGGVFGLTYYINPITNSLSDLTLVLIGIAIAFIVSAIFTFITFKDKEKTNEEKIAA